MEKQVCLWMCTYQALPSKSIHRREWKWGKISTKVIEYAPANLGLYSIKLNAWHNGENNICKDYNSIFPLCVLKAKEVPLSV